MKTIAIQYSSFMATTLLFHHGVSLPTTNLRMNLEFDAFSSGQVNSKLWAAEKLEWCVKEHITDPLDIYVLGGWYSLLHFILKVRNNIKINSCRSFDLDPSACSVANAINNTWELQDWAFRAYPQDINTIDYPVSVNCVINTVTEHVKGTAWYDRIPNGTLCLFQSNNLQHSDHINIVSSIEELEQKFPLAETFFTGSKCMDSYTRYMTIGKK
jgi:hypothetical protein